ncbi:MAG: hypothetical protein PHE31_04360 [Tissierellia bacterium]|mgnify:CR=1 FL=1|nr:hypothetical protein [Tissierellia bacterium]
MLLFVQNFYDADAARQIKLISAISAESIPLKVITYRESTISAYVDGVKCAQINFENYNGGAAYTIDVPLNSSGTTVVTLTYSEPHLEDGLYTISINNQ